MSIVYRLATAGLLALGIAACAREPVADPVPPPQRPYDAKTQLEYGNPPPPPPRGPRY